MSVIRRYYKTKSGEMKTSPNWSYKFSHNKKCYSGICAGCNTRLEAEDFEMKKIEAVSKITSQKSLIELFNQCKQLIVAENPVPLIKAWVFSQSKPRKHSAGKERTKFKENHWNDFLFYVGYNHPTIKNMQNVTVSIAENYIAALRRYGKFQKYIETKKNNVLAPPTLNEYHMTLIQVFNLLKHETGMPVNPFADIPKLPQENSMREAFSVEQLHLILANANECLHPIFMVGLFAGLRLGDICLLKKSDVDFARHFIYRKQNKTGRLASIPMLPILENYIAELVSKYPDSEYIMPEQASQYLKCKSTLSKRMKYFLDKDLKINTQSQYHFSKRRYSYLDFHSLRHTFCSLAGVSGVPLSIVQSIVGHLTPGMTEMYSRHVDEQDKLKYIQLFGKTVEQLPASSPDFVVALPVPKMETEREKLIEMAKTLPLETIRTLLAAIPVPTNKPEGKRLSGKGGGILEKIKHFVKKSEGVQ